MLTPNHRYQQPSLSKCLPTYVAHRTKYARIRACKWFSFWSGIYAYLCHRNDGTVSELRRRAGETVSNRGIIRKPIFSKDRQIGEPVEAL